jgi:uncharacterized membrane protein YcaP (DUF421 family)
MFLFIYFRIMSNRCSAPVTLFDTIVGVALGSVLGAIVTGKHDVYQRLGCQELC